MGQKEVYEIERKWIVSEEFFNKLTSIKERVISHQIIKQSYLFSEGEGNSRVELRVRKHRNVAQSDSYNKFRMDIKTGVGLKRVEISKELYQQEYEALETRCVDTVDKDYYRIFIGGRFIDISSVNSGEFYYLEVEFRSESDANQFSLEEFFLESGYNLKPSEGDLEEVTNNSEWSMGNVAKRISYEG